MDFKKLAYVIPLISISFLTLDKPLHGQTIEDSAKSKKEEFLEHVKSYEGAEYAYGKRKEENIDCLGVVFLSYAKTFDENWKDYNAEKPRNLIYNENLGKPIEGLDGVVKDSIDYSKLKEGDIIFYLKEGSKRTLTNLQGQDYKICHVNTYIDKDKNLVLDANSYGESFKPTNLESFLSESDANAIYVVRPNGGQ